jgi:riboflavin synthase
MFTGIIEEIGRVKSIRRYQHSIDISISCKLVLTDIKLGDSICVNGICLTASKIDHDHFIANVMPETMKKTSLASLESGSKVNLERALGVNGRLGGHIVNGHIDGVGVIHSLEQDENALWIEMKTSPEVLKYIVYKGSVSLDGTSLTIAEVSHESFKVSLIPLTREMTVLGMKKVGELVNIECDILGKYIEKFLTGHKNNENKVISKKPINMNYLKENGFA